MALARPPGRPGPPAARCGIPDEPPKIRRTLGAWLRSRLLVGAGPVRAVRELHRTASGRLPLVARRARHTGGSASTWSPDPWPQAYARAERRSMGAARGSAGRRARRGRLALTVTYGVDVGGLGVEPPPCARSAHARIGHCRSRMPWPAVGHRGNHRGPPLSSARARRRVSIAAAGAGSRRPQRTLDSSLAIHRLTMKTCSKRAGRLCRRDAFGRRLQITGRRAVKYR